ncbi:MAG: GFA family protein [Pseudomonadota bacterium]
MALTGSCFCGRIAYEVRGPLRDARSCHCSRCRKAFSAQASAYALVETGTFSWIDGEDLLTSFVGDDGVGLQFCSVCGSTLCGVVDGKVHGITLGCLNEDPGLQLRLHLFVGSKAAWETLPHDADCHDAFPPGWVQLNETT